MKEQFKPIRGWEGIFEVSNLGYVRNVKTLTKRYGSVIDSGYMRLKLTGNGKEREQHRVHKLVLSAFKPKPNNKSEVNHIDGNKTNNRLDNLEWVSSSENKEHAIKNGYYKTNQRNLTTGETYYKAIRKLIKKLSKIDKGLLLKVIEDTNKLI